MTAIIIPTIFTNSVLVLQERLEQYEFLVKRVQLDVADDVFSAQPTLRPDKLISCATMLIKDVHLMTMEPIEWLECCAEEGVKTAIGQIEHMSSQKEFVEEAKNLGLKVGLAVDLETAWEDLEWPAAAAADQLLVMTVRAGQEGQKLSQEGLRRVKLIREKGFKKEVCVDGGVNEMTIRACVKAGADVLAIGSALWKTDKIESQYQKLLELAQK